MVILETVSSDSTPDKHYEIRLGNNPQPELYCTCPAWKFSAKGNKDCKHLRAFRAANPEVVKGIAAEIEELGYV
jgi:predicted nucleic acid-binding Zn finger protein